VREYPVYFKQVLVLQGPTATSVMTASSAKCGHILVCCQFSIICCRVGPVKLCLSCKVALHLGWLWRVFFGHAGPVQQIVLHAPQLAALGAFCCVIGVIFSLLPRLMWSCPSRCACWPWVCVLCRRCRMWAASLWMWTTCAGRRHYGQILFLQRYKPGSGLTNSVRW
jgi:hypothetical protein